MTSATDRYKICVDVGERSADYKWHIIDTEADIDLRNSLFTYKDELRKRFAEYRQQNICPHSNTVFGEAMGLSEANKHLNVTKRGFTGPPPEKVCTYCWNEVKRRIDEQEQKKETIKTKYDNLGFVLRWKQKGRAREEWYDISVSPETTFNELDTLLRRQFSTLDSMHVRLYGLEDEYLDSSLEIYGGIMEGITDKPQSRTPPITIREVFEENQLTEGDRLSLAYDLATHRSFYCIIKKAVDPRFCDPDEIAESAIIDATDTAVIENCKSKTTEPSTNTDTTAKEYTKDNDSETSSPDEKDKQTPDKSVEDVIDSLSSKLDAETESADIDTIIEE